jgi:DNA-binding FrmR family transcriptional regulator
LEQQADFIVQEIQLVLDQLRLAKPSQDFENTINRISNIVEEIVKVTTETLEVEPNMEMGFDIVDQLTAVNEKLNVSSRVLKSDTSKVVKQQVASNAYEIAKVMFCLT